MRYLGIVLLFMTSLFSSEIHAIEKKIIVSMLEAINHSSARLVVYSDDKKIENLLKESDIEITNQCSNAKIAILSKSKTDNQCNLTIPIITLKYNLLNTYPNAVGSFFWQKGRPNIIFIRSRLDAQGIILNSNFNDFVEEKIW